MLDAARLLITFYKRVCLRFIDFDIEFTPFMEYEDSLLCLQEPATGPILSHMIRVHNSHPVSVRSILNTILHLHLGFQMVCLLPTL
jgi:hypothetical protein